MAQNYVITKYVQFNFRKVSYIQISPPWYCCHCHGSNSYQRDNLMESIPYFETSAGFLFVTGKWIHLTLAYSTSCYSQTIIQTLFLTFQGQANALICSCCCCCCCFTCTIWPSEETYQDLVLVSYGYCKKLPQTWWFKTTKVCVP